jgi:hypothetical protein
MTAEHDTTGSASQAAPSGVPPPPWEDPGLDGGRGLYFTLRDLLLSPRSFFQNLGEAGISEPLTFGLLTGVLGLAAACIWQTLIAQVLLLPMEEESWMALLLAPPGTTEAVVFMLLSPLLVLLNLILSAACLWFSVRLLRPGVAFTPVWRVSSYAQGGAAAGVIPGLGLILATVWVLVLIYQGVKAKWELTGGQGFLALMLFLGFQTLALALAAGVILGALFIFLGLAYLFL